MLLWVSIGMKSRVPTETKITCWDQVDSVYFAAFRRVGHSYEICTTLFLAMQDWCKPSPFCLYRQELRLLVWLGYPNLSGQLHELTVLLLEQNFKLGTFPLSITMIKIRSKLVLTFAYMFHGVLTLAFCIYVSWSCFKNCSIRRIGSRRVTHFP